MRDVKISACMNGFIVRVGCQTLVFTSALELLTALREYLANPEQVERNFVERYGLKNSEIGIAGGLSPLPSGFRDEPYPVAQQASTGGNAPSRY